MDRSMQEAYKREAWHSACGGMCDTHFIFLALKSQKSQLAPMRVFRADRVLSTVYDIIQT